MKNKRLYYAEISAIVLLFVVSIVLACAGVVKINRPVTGYTLSGTADFVRTLSAEEEGFEDEAVCLVEFSYGEYTLTINYSYEEWEALEEGKTVTGYIYESEDSDIAVAFDHEATDGEISAAVKDVLADGENNLFGAAIAIALTAVGLCVITFWDGFFTTYEKIWFISILVLASIVSVIFPEESTNGISGIIIMILYLADTFLNVLCELLISKQSKWNFIVSVFVEIAEILICVVLAYRFATMATTLFFWLPIDIISFVNWHKHPDKQEEELTIVRKLSGVAAVLVISGIFVWTIVIGWLLSGLDITSGLFNGNETLAQVVCYLDACASAVGIANGLFILFRFREQWIAWYIEALLETIINVLSGQYVLLVLKLGYFTNTTYGYVKWTKYIKSRSLPVEEKNKE